MREGNTAHEVDCDHHTWNLGGMAPPVRNDDGVRQRMRMVRMMRGTRKKERRAWTVSANPGRAPVRHDDSMELSPFDYDGETLDLYPTRESTQVPRLSKKRDHPRK